MEKHKYHKFSMSIKRHAESLKSRTQKLKTDIPMLFLALQDRKTPLIAKLFAGITVAYALSPIDFIPDFIPVIGCLDDIILLPVLITLTIKFIPKEILKEKRKQAEGMWQDGKPKKWYYAVPIILIYVLIILLIVNHPAPQGCLPSKS